MTTPLTRAPNCGTTNISPPTPFPATVADGTTWSSDLIPAAFGGVTFGATSDQIVTLEIQRYADLAGLVPVGPLSTQALTASTPGWTGFNDGLPFLSFQLFIVNASGSLATISHVAALSGPAG